MLNRDGRQATAPFAALINEPANNIYVRPQDTIYVFTQPQTFVAFGATGQQGQFAFGASRLSLAEAIAKAGGLNDSLADPACVFLYRGEHRKVAEQLGVDCSQFGGPVIPVIYSINLRDPAGYFLATQFEMTNKDVIVTSNASAIETIKLLTYLRLITGTVNDPLLAALNGNSS
jgi:polysaccharide export outer membrane protein